MGLHAAKTRVLYYSRPFRDGFSSTGWDMLYYDELPTKFEVPNLTRYGNMKRVAKCRKCGGFELLEVTQNSAIR